MKSKPTRFDPRARIAIFLLVVLVVLLNTGLSSLVVGYAILMLLLLYTGQLPSHLKIVLVSCLPFLLMLLGINVYLLNDGNKLLGLLISLNLFLKIIVLAATFQFTFAVGSTELIDILRFSKLNNYIKLIILESYSGIAETNQKVNHIITARLSRGFLKKRTVGHRIQQLPYVIRPLISSLLYGSFIKSNTWKQQELKEKFQYWTSSGKTYHIYPVLISVLSATLVTVWAVLSILTKYFIRS